MHLKGDEKCALRPYYGLPLQTNLTYIIYWLNPLSKLLKTFLYVSSGTVGGSIGVCLGFSFVTCYEVVFFIYDYLTAWWKLKDNSGVI